MEITILLAAYVATAFLLPIIHLTANKMERTIQIFNSPQFGEVRTIVDADNQPLFCLGDVCKVLSLRTTDVKNRLTKGVVSTYPLKTAGGIQQVNFVNEDGLYDVILDSRKPEARKFRKWITSEVLPEIRKNGGYITTNDGDSPEEIMAKALVVAQATLKRKEERLKQLQEENSTQQQLITQQTEELQQAAPKVSYYDNTLQSVNTMTTTQVAKSIGIEAHTLNQKLKEAGVIFNQSGQWMLKSPFSHWSLHKTRTHMYTRSDGSTGTSIQTVWTERGRRFISALKECGWIVSRAVKLLRGELVA